MKPEIKLEITEDDLDRLDQLLREINIHFPEVDIKLEAQKPKLASQKT